jgi:hypothetical protein
MTPPLPTTDAATASNLSEGCGELKILESENQKAISDF